MKVRVAWLGTVVVTCFYFSLLFDVNAALPIVGEMDVREKVIRTLYSQGLRTGFNDKTNLCIGVGSAIAEVDSASAKKGFFGVLANLHKVAYMNALRDCLKRTGFRYSAQARMRIVSDHGTGKMEFMELSKALGEGRFSQGEVLHVQEAWNGKEYAVAVSVGWALGSGSPGIPDVPRLSRVNDAFCRKWLQSVDKGGLSGFRCVRDDSGQRHIFGFGMADVKGLSGKRLVNALRLSRMRAVQSVAFALKSDVVMSEILEKGMIKGSGDMPSTWEKFTSSVVLKCSQYVPPIEDVYDGYVKHSLTGCDIYITACAVCITEERK